MTFFPEDGVMNVRLLLRHVPAGVAERTLCYGGVAGVVSDGQWLTLSNRERTQAVTLPLSDIREIAVDDDPGDWW